MAEASQNYRKKQAILCLLVFLCIIVAFVADKASVAVGAILVACGLCYAAAKIQPPPPEELHHH